MAKRYADVSMTIPVYFVIEYDDEDVENDMLENIAFETFDNMPDMHRYLSMQTAYKEAAYINSIRDCYTDEELPYNYKGE